MKEYHNRRTGGHDHEWRSGLVAPDQCREVKYLLMASTYMLLQCGEGLVVFTSRHWAPDIVNNLLKKVGSQSL